MYFSTVNLGCADQCRWVSHAIECLPAGRGSACQANASTREYSGVLVSTDPPYYDNVGYADLSDFFYVWLRRSLGGIFPELLGTMLTPKADELVADPFRHEGTQVNSLRMGTQTSSVESAKAHFATSRSRSSMRSSRRKGMTTVAMPLLVGRPCWKGCSRQVGR